MCVCVRVCIVRERFNPKKYLPITLVCIKKGKSLSTGLKWRRRGSRGRKEKSVRDREKNYKSPKKICKCCKATYIEFIPWSTVYIIMMERRLLVRS